MVENCYQVLHLVVISFIEIDYVFIYQIVILIVFIVCFDLNVVMMNDDDRFNFC